MTDPPNHQNPVAAVPPTPPFTVTAIQEPSSINWEKVIYVIFDLETTGVNRIKNEIIELAAVILDRNGIPIEDASFMSFVRPKNPIPSYISEITNITNNHVCDANTFPEVAGAFLRFIQQYADDHNDPVDHILLVGHNGRVFDIPFFLHQLCNYKMQSEFFEDIRLGFGLDTMRIARKAIAADTTNGVPSKYNLRDLYEFVTGKVLENAHRAFDDVKATTTILCYPAFWESRKVDIFKVTVSQTTQQEQAEEAGAIDDSSDDGSSVASSEEEEDEEEDEGGGGGGDDAMGNRSWEDLVDYIPNPVPIQQFKERFTSPVQSRRPMVGLQCHPMDVNTPIRAWRQIFTKTILDKIVKYTNEYGEAHSKTWSDISRKDLDGFIAILFVSGIQKRKDKPSHWFSENPLLENPVMKKIMSRKKFFTMLRFLHCCPNVRQDPTADGYDPAYKVSELRDSLERRYTSLLVPGQQLSLDETLIRAFGRIKFKVRIITKAARYGIKLYVITDAATAYVLRVIIYTGKSTYAAANEQPMEEKKTVQIVGRLVEPFVGTHRTIYVDRFYTSLDLLISLANKNLYITGTMMANRLPAGIKVDKKSATYRAMKRGDSIRSKFIFRKEDGTVAEAGLVGWRDRNMVYCLSNDANNFEVDQCHRRGDGGIVQLTRPVSIAEYNKYMGGVDLADMIRLHCDSTLMGQKRWWLKLFFYLLDVGTSNALVLFNEQLKIAAGEGGEFTKWNIVEFKLKLVEDLVGKSLDDLHRKSSVEEEAEHKCVPIPGGNRVKCAYCGLMSRESRTRYQCVVCGVPLCSMGSGKVKHDCFTEAHKTPDRIEMVLKKHQRMQMKNPNRNSK